MVIVAARALDTSQRKFGQLIAISLHGTKAVPVYPGLFLLEAIEIMVLMAS